MNKKAVTSSQLLGLTKNIEKLRIKSNDFPEYLGDLILLPRNWTRRLGGRRLTAEEQRAINGVVLAHENLEHIYTNTKPKTAMTKFRFRFNHESPGVLLTEHNILKGLQSSASNKVRTLFNKLRTKDGSRKYLADLTNNPDFEPGISNRFSRHAIKRLIELDQKVNKLG